MKYITYLTIYSGTKLPPFYIGSTTEAKFYDGYHGTVKSKRYKETYNEELKSNPHLFDSLIIEEFDDRKSATECELLYQTRFNVVKNPEFFNMAFATKNGSHGMDVAGENNPFFGKTHSAKFSKSHSKRMSGSNNPMFGRTGNNCPNGKLFGENNPFFGKTHSAESRLKCGIKNRKSPVWHHENALRELWLKLDKPKSVTVFSKVARSLGFPAGSYKNIHKMFIKESVDD